jgi:hypothetical protein
MNGEWKIPDPYPLPFPRRGSDVMLFVKLKIFDV